MTTSNRATFSRPLKRRIAGAVLVVVALAALLDRYTEVNFGLIAPLALGVGFLVWSLIAREWGLLIPGGVLVGIGAGMVMQRVVNAGAAWDQALFFWCFAAGWGLIWALSRAFFRRNVMWPLIPGGIMLVLGFGQLWQGEMQTVWRSVSTWWPFLLLAVAAWLWFGPGRGSK